MEYYLAVKRDEATVCMNPESIMLRKGSQTHKVPLAGFLLYEISCIGKVIRKQIGGCQGLGVEGREGMESDQLTSTESSFAMMNMFGTR